MHQAFRCGRLLAVAFATYFATGCGSVNLDQPPPQSVGASVESPSTTRLAEVQIHVARAALGQGNLGTALELFEKAHNTAPQDARPLVGKGDVLFAQRRFAEAATAYRSALARQPGMFEAHEGLGKALVSQHKYQEGLREFESALAIRSDAALLNKIGVTHEMLGHGDTAQKYFRESLALEADSLIARNNLALSLGVSGAYDEALTHMEKVVASPKSSERHRANLAFIYGLSGRSMDSVPPRVAQAAASKGWDDGFFSRTRQIAETGNRTAVLDLLNNRRPAAAAPPTPAMAALPEMPDVPEMPASEAASSDLPAAAPEKADRPDASARPTESTMASRPTVLVPPPPPPPATEQTAEQRSAEPADPSQPAEQLAERVAEPREEPANEPPAADATGTIRTDAELPAEEAPVDMAMRTAPAAPDAPRTPADTPVAATPASAPGGAYRVQLGAFKTTRWLTAMLAKLSANAADLLPGDALNVGYERDIYQVRSYGLPDRKAAGELCGELGSRGFACFVTRMGEPSSGHSLSLADANDPEAIRRFVAGLPKIQVASAAAPAVMADETGEPAAALATGSIVPPPPPAPKDSVAMLRPSDSTAVNSPDVPSIPASAETKPHPGIYRVQFAAYRLARHLTRGIAVLKKAADELLPPLEGLVRAEAEGTAIPFRLRSAPLESRDEATELCRKLAEKQVECLVIRHGARYWRPLA